MTVSQEVIQKIQSANGDPEKIKEILSSLNKGTGGARIPDRPAYIQSLNSISEVRRALKVAHAKKSKVPSSADKYQKEIEAAKARLNELIAQANQAKDPIQAFRQLGEEPRKVLNLWLDRKGTDLDQKLDKLLLDSEGHPLTQKARKELISDMKAELHPTLKEELVQTAGVEVVEIFEDRLNRNDQRVANLVRKHQLYILLTGRAKQQEETKQQAKQEAKARTEDKGPKTLKVDIPEAKVQKA